MNNKLTDRKIAVILARAEICDDSVLTDYADIVAAMRELQERRKAEAPAPVMVAECAICGKSCTNANHPMKAVAIESPLSDSERAELHDFRRAACTHGFPPGAHTQGVIGCVECSGRLVMIWEQSNGGDCES